VVFSLKRFEFDYNTMKRFKVNDYCEFPETINFRKWTKEGIEEATKEKSNKPEDENDIPDDIDEEDFKEEETKA